MAEGKIEIEASVAKDKLIKAILDYEKYPEFVDGVKNVQVTKISDHETDVTYSVNLIKEMTYTLKHKEDSTAGVISWSLIQSDLFKKNEGSWSIEAISPTTSKIKYVLEVDFKIPVPGFVLKPLVKGNLPRMIESFVNRAKKL